MNMHDDYFDVAHAAGVFKKAYAKWGRTVDGKLDEKTKKISAPSSAKEQKRAAKKLAQALVTLAEQAMRMRADMRYRYGWKVD